MSSRMGIKEVAASLVCVKCREGIHMGAIGISSPDSGCVDGKSPECSFQTDVCNLYSF